MANANHKTSPKKPKLVRDSFTIPKAEFLLIEDMKARAMALGTSVKKSELLRAGLKLLQGLNDKAYLAALGAVPTLKTGRPSSEAPATESVQPVEKTAVRRKAAATPKTKPLAQASLPAEKKKPGKTAASSLVASKAGTQAKAPPQAAAAPKASRQAVRPAPTPESQAAAPAPVKAEAAKPVVADTASA